MRSRVRSTDWTDWRGRAGLSVPGASRSFNMCNLPFVERKPRRERSRFQVGANARCRSGAPREGLDPLRVREIEAVQRLVVGARLQLAAHGPEPADEASRLALVGSAPG